MNLTPHYNIFLKKEKSLLAQALGLSINPLPQYRSADFFLFL